VNAFWNTVCKLYQCKFLVCYSVFIRVIVYCNMLHYLAVTPSVRVSRTNFGTDGSNTARDMRRFLRFLALWWSYLVYAKASGADRSPP